MPATKTPTDLRLAPSAAPFGTCENVGGRYVVSNGSCGQPRGLAAWRWCRGTASWMRVREASMAGRLRRRHWPAGTLSARGASRPVPYPRTRCSRSDYAHRHTHSTCWSVVDLFDTLSDRLTTGLSNLRGKGRRAEADIDATAREIRIALLEADVALPVVRTFIAGIKERAKGAEVSQALNPAQQVVKIVNEELVAVLGGETRRLQLAKTPPTAIMLAGRQGSGKTTLAGKLAQWLAG